VRVKPSINIEHSVMAGLVPAIPMRMAQCVPERDARHKAGHDGACVTVGA